MQISPAALRLPFDTSYARLPERFFARAEPQPVAAPRLIKLNAALAEQLGLDPEALASAAGVQLLAGNVAPEGATPIALGYAGHQFGNFVPLLGDGRAVLLGEVVGRDGQRRDIQLKGSGPTPFSRRGDGRAALGPVLREYVLSESMAALGIPTTRALAAVTTGEAVYREEALPGAVFARVAASHIRVGTFQLFASRGDTEGLQLLAEHAIARHYPEARAAANPVLALFEGVVARQAALVARWLLVGFIHGVMNTDNSAISGETIDYGPCAFLDAYHPGAVFSSIDVQGRYAYGNQPRIAQWNLARLGECLLPLLDTDENKALELAQGALAGFAPQFQAAYLDGFRRKFGLMAPQDGDAELMQDLLGRMAENEADFTLLFRHLADAAADPGADVVLRALFNDPAAFDAWAPRWRARLAEEGGDPAARRGAMRSSNPAVIPRNHQLQAVIDAAVRREDFAPFEALLDVLSRPFEDRPPGDRYTLPPQPEERVLRTFCGT